jgi:hypothetical protein
LVIRRVFLRATSTNWRRGCLLPNQSGYITAEDFQRLTGEELDEFSEQDCNAIRNLAAKHGCKIRTTPIERRVYFMKNSR